eukprot:Filipodium_phascolosomae@DN6788_c0_g1_i1.p1
MTPRTIGAGKRNKKQESKSKFYNPWRLLDITKIKLKHRAEILRNWQRPQRTVLKASNTFLLTRFGWMRRKKRRIADKTGWKTRRMEESEKLEFV